jgi:hypothetical protein
MNRQNGLFSAAFGNGVPLSVSHVASRSGVSTWSQGTGPAFFADPEQLERQVAGLPAAA